MRTEICKDLNALHPKVKELALKLLEECKKAGLNIKISETYRTTERQDDLYAQGRTRSGNIVTYSKGSSMSSYHQWRLAFDIYNDVPGDAYNINILNKAGALGEKLGLEWGGSWAGLKDRPHFQYTFSLSIADLRAGKRPPENLGMSYEDAVKILAEKGIITSPNIWLNTNDFPVNNVKSLIKKVAQML